MSSVFKVERVPTGPVPFQVGAPDGAPVVEINEFLGHLSREDLQAVLPRSLLVESGGPSSERAEPGALPSPEMRGNR